MCQFRGGKSRTLAQAHTHVRALLKVLRADAGLGEQLHCLGHVALIPVVRVISLELAGNRHRGVVVSAQDRQGKEDRANARCELVSVPEVASAILSQDSPQAFSRNAVPAHPGVARNFVAQTQDSPVASVGDMQEGLKVALVQTDRLLVLTVSR